MKLTEEQVEDIALKANESMADMLTEEGAVAFTKAVIAAIPKPKPTVFVEQQLFMDGVSKIISEPLEVGTALYAETPPATSDKVAGLEVTDEMIERAWIAVKFADVISKEQMHAAISAALAAVKGQ